MRSTVRAVGDDRGLRRAWVDAAERCHAGDPNWVPQLRADVFKGTDRRRNPFLRLADVEHFVLFEEDKPVGRVAATVYPEHIEHSGVAEGFFGFLSCPERLDAAGELLGAAEIWLEERGMTRVAGPYNYFVGQEMGLRTHGFDTPPAMFQTYNPPGYRELLRECGYATAFEVGTYTLADEELDQVAEKAVTEADQWLERLELTSRPMRPGRFREDIELVRRLFNQSFADNHGVLPYDRDVFESLVLPLRRFLDPQLIRFLEREGEPVAFIVAAPDLNPILRRLNGSVGPVDLLRLPRWKRSLESAVLLLIGAQPDQPMGMGPVLFGETLKAVAAGGYRRLHTTWVHQDNAALSLLISRLCGELPFATRSEIVFKELTRR